MLGIAAIKNKNDFSTPIFWECYAVFNSNKYLRTYDYSAYKNRVRISGFCMVMNR